MEVRLILDSGGQKGRETTLSRGVYLVGRSKLCQIRPKNRYVSRKHCALIHRKRELLIQDLGSTSGTFVNGKRIQTATAISLSDGDRLQIGKSKFRIAISGQVTPQLAPQAESPKKKKRNRRATADGASQNKVNGHPAAIPDDDDAEKAFAGPPSNTAENPAEQTHLVDDVLNMLEDENEQDSDSPSSVIIGGNLTFLPGIGDEQSVDPEDDSDGNVDFAAPKSSESLDDSQPVPSYALRQDWDVKSVYSWVSQKEAYAKQDERLAKRKLKEKINAKRAERGEAPIEEAEKPKPANLKPSPNLSSDRNWTDWLDADNARPVLLSVVGVVFLVWVVWNVWKLWSFEG